MSEKKRSISGGDCSESDIIESASNANEAISYMNSSQISNLSTESSHIKNNITITHKIINSSCRFPKLEECAHFHYERVQLGKIHVRLIDEKFDSQSNGSVSQISDNASQNNKSICLNYWFIVQVTAGRSEPFLIKRSLENFRMLDDLLHQCVYDRKISGLEDLKNTTYINLEKNISNYLQTFSSIASESSPTCGPVLTWLQLDNKGRRLPVADSDTMRSINTPAVAAAYGIRRYTAQACDEISIEVGDMISVIDMPNNIESVWWRGKKSHLQKSQYEVGFFPQSCVATIGDKIPRHMILPAPLVGVGSLVLSPTKPVLRKHGKLIAFFRSFILSRPSRRRLKQSGIYKERVFSCDLGEHLLNSGQEIPMVLKCCAEFIEEFGIVDGIYRLSGITSNIQKLRRAFDEERVPDLTHPDIKQDIHAVSSLLKMYFRELPNPLCTYQLYDHFVDAIQTRSEGEEVRLKLIKQTVQKLPPPHYRTLKYLSSHLNKISRYADNTGMTDRNLAIVWAPNLLRSPALESGGVAALRGVGVQAVVTSYLITNCELIFNPIDEFERFFDLQGNDSITDTESMIDQRDHEPNLSIERPKSLSVGGAKLLTLEEAQIKHNRSDSTDQNKSIPINTSTLRGAYIEVGGGPSSLPDKYHTVLPIPRGWQKRKTHSWKSLFSRAPRQSNSNHDIKDFNATSKTTYNTSECDANYITENDEKVADETNKIKNTKTSDSFCDKISMDVCHIRSNSVDSLRTAGHSRSVSHDSYFDLLQSPIKGLTTCPSRELSELGLNFDREEPEMRIFSESESLVSSPKCTNETNRRVLRARPEEFTSATNSVNPSPKKQPRLNLPSPNQATNTQWQNIDDNLCKRYKLEDHFSDIQYIDCNTPEHTINSTGISNKIFTSVQVHNPPAMRNDSIDSKQLSEKTNANDNLGNRYSYPGLSAEKHEQTGRFSYPGVGNKTKDNSNHLKMKVDTDASDFKSQESYPKDATNLHTTFNTNRNSFFDQTLHSKENIDNLLRSNSADVFKKNDLKLSAVTPQSPFQSPRYSLLVGDTSSGTSSSINTPIYDVEMLPGMNTSVDKTLNELTKCTIKLSSTPNTFSDMIVQEIEKPLQNPCDGRTSITLLKRELSLDLDKSPKCSIAVGCISLNKKVGNINSSPNSPNHTLPSENTSQSMTPSDFCYQNLNRTSNVVSLESSPKSELNQCFDTLDHSFNTYENIDSKNSKPTTPIKSTISIIYNIKSPEKNLVDCKSNTSYGEYEDMCSTNDEMFKITETNFDDKIVYEQLKFYKSAVTEVNDMLDNGNGLRANETSSDNNNLNKTVQVVPNFEHDQPIAETMNLDVFYSTESKTLTDFEENEDIFMNDNDIHDSLENDQNLSLYENVELKQPGKFYENIVINKIITEKNVDLPTKVDIKLNNFTVRQLATKFETSPVEAMPPFEFFKTNIKLKPEIRKSPCVIRANNSKQLNKTSITRSLDENAFIREFGSQPNIDYVKNIKKIQEILNISNENISSRRKSLEFISPKNLNPPKRLPELIDVEGEICKISDKQSMLKLDLTKKFGNKLIATCNDKITPTTENRISLIQQNVSDNFTKTIEEDRNSSIKVLESCKLDRERIEKIKEERRHQLNEKYRSESFRGEREYNKIKSKSKCELRDLKDNEKCTTESLRLKSKSRGDIRCINDNSDKSPIEIMSALEFNRQRPCDEKIQSSFTKQSPNSKLINMGGDFDAKLRSKFEKRSNIELLNKCDTQSVSIKSSQQREKMSPQRSIRDVAAMFESRLQNP